MIESTEEAVNFLLGAAEELETQWRLIHGIACDSINALPDGPSDYTGLSRRDVAGMDLSMAQEALDCCAQWLRKVAADIKDADAQNSCEDGV